MKTIISISVIILFIFSPSYSQFLKEADYPIGSLVRVLLQDQSERYFYFDKEDIEIKIANSSHQIINSIQTPPCDGNIVIYSARSDFNNIDLGILCSCSTTSQQNGGFILDQDGNVVKQFIEVPHIDDRYIIDFDEENYHTYIYDTRSLELINEIPQFELSYGSKRFNDDDYYYGNNGVDSIFVFDSSLSKIRDIGFDFIDKNNKRLTLASIHENNEASFYFYATEYNLYRKLIDENGSILYEFTYNFPLLYKYGQKLQVVTIINQGISSYDVNEQELFEVVPNTNSNWLRSRGKYIAIEYDPITTRAEFYNYKRELDFAIDLFDPYLTSGPYTFVDHLGNDYFFYYQNYLQTENIVIYKNQEYLQTINDIGFMFLLGTEDLTTKLVTYPVQDTHKEIYGLELTSTKDISKSTFSISPNPVNEALTISGGVENEMYTIYDVTGKFVQKGYIDDIDLVIDVSGFSLGVYFIRMNKKDKNYEVKKFIKA